MSGAGANGRRRVTLSDLTNGQLEELELAVGLPVDRWDEGKSFAVLQRHMAMIAHGMTEDEVKALSTGELRRIVSLRLEPERDPEREPRASSP